MSLRAAWIVAVALLLPGCRTTPDSAGALERFEFERPQMGLPFRMVLYASDAVQAQRASEAAWARIAALNASLSDYEAESELSRLSRTSGSNLWVRLQPDLARVLTTAQAIARESDGAFDVTVGPEVMLWRRARRQRQLPSPEALEAARAATGWKYLHLRRRDGSWEALLERPGMRLDLGGIAKGFALDEAAQVLRREGVRRFLVSGGGDIVVGDPPPGMPGWKVEAGVFDASNAATPPPRFLSLRNTGLATSGDTFQRVEIGGVRYSHIVDPRTGVGLTDHSLVTVIAPTGMMADALSKVISVLGPDPGIPLARRHDAEVFLLRQPGSTVEETISPGFGRWWLTGSPRGSAAETR